MLLKLYLTLNTLILFFGPLWATLTPTQKASQTFKFYIKKPDANESQSQFTTNNNDLKTLDPMKQYRKNFNTKFYDPN